MPTVESRIARVRQSRLQAREDNAFIGRAERDSLDGLYLELRAVYGARGDDQDIIALLASSAEEMHAVAKLDFDVRREADARISEALDRLHALASSGEISRRAPAELRQACGFTRVMISSARGSKWLPDTILPENPADSESAEFERFAQGRNEIPLARMMLETEMMRRRVPIMVEDAEADPRTYKPLIRVTGSHSYVAAPITTNRRVIGFLHADRHGQKSPVTSGDLESLKRFAAGFSVLFECAVLRERIEAQRARMADLLAKTSVELSALAQSPLSLVPEVGESISDMGSSDVRSGAGRQYLLTRREQDVLTLLSAGATNRAIARELVLSPDTVKSHVANLMRKLRVSSRSAAVAKYLQMRPMAKDQDAE
ncbi:hypothetical protein GCM10009596_28950 [Arthrobacter rhombi]|uniref:LuxR C-terminal-related transcriptional regulator n=1 Tax=Arthrobacter rhombi TaxID=71253 RepID=UPI0031DD1504